MEPLPPIENISTSPVLLEMRITLHEDDKVIVSGPIENKPIAYYMLIQAMDAVKEFKNNRQYESGEIKVDPDGSGPRLVS